MFHKENIKTVYPYQPLVDLFYARVIQASVQGPPRLGEEGGGSFRGCGAEGERLTDCLHVETSNITWRNLRMKANLFSENLQQNDYCMQMGIDMTMGCFSVQSLIVQVKVARVVLTGFATELSLTVGKYQYGNSGLFYISLPAYTVTRQIVHLLTTIFLLFIKSSSHPFLVHSSVLP